MAPRFEAFTVKSTGRLSQVITAVKVFPAFDPNSPPTPLPVGADEKALWDTGASKSVVSKVLAQKLLLQPVGVTKVNHAGGTSETPTYLVNFQLPHGVGVVGILASEFPAMPGGFDVIIGMDIITLGDFSITNVGGQTWVSFRTPSKASIDYVVEVNRANFAGVGRNDPCPCGSGRKYKRCCGPKGRTSSWLSR